MKEELVTEILPCFVCNKILKASFPEFPSGATVFTSEGNYGSTVFDPGTGEFLVINICDQCLKAGQERVKLGQRVAAHPIVYYTKWEAE